MYSLILDIRNLSFVYSNSSIEFQLKLNDLNDSSTTEIMFYID